MKTKFDVIVEAAPHLKDALEAVEGCGQETTLRWEEEEERPAHSCLIKAFSWPKSIQGAEFWVKEYRKLGGIY